MDTGINARTNEAAVREAAGIAPVLAKYGVSLSEKDIAMLEERRYRALRETGRVEFGRGVLRELALAFCDSPFVDEDFAELLGEMQDLFYEFRNESEDLLTDEELIDLMKAHFDGPCQGSIEYMAGTTLSDLMRQMRQSREEY